MVADGMSPGKRNAWNSTLVLDVSLNCTSIRVVDAASAVVSSGAVVSPTEAIAAKREGAARGCARRRKHA
jgi:hypothetical protein